MPTVADRIATVNCNQASLGLAEFEDSFDFVLVFAVAHEVPGASREAGAMKCGALPSRRPGRIVVEPRSRVSAEGFVTTIATAATLRSAHLLPTSRDGLAEVAFGYEPTPPKQPLRLRRLEGPEAPCSAKPLRRAKKSRYVPTPPKQPLRLRRLEARAGHDARPAFAEAPAFVKTTAGKPAGKQARTLATRSSDGPPLVR